MRGADGYVSSGKRGYSGQEGLLFLGCIPAPSVFRRRLPSPVDVHRCQGLSARPLKGHHTAPRQPSRT